MTKHIMKPWILFLVLLAALLMSLTSCGGKSEPTMAPATMTISAQQRERQGTGEALSPTPTSSPTSIPIVPTMTPTASAQEVARKALTALSQRLGEAIDNHDRHQIILLNETLNTLEQATPDRVAKLHSSAQFALDTAAGCYYLDQLPHRRIRLTSSDGNPLSYPIVFTIAHNKLFFIESGNLYMSDLSALLSGAESLSAQNILNRDAFIDGFPIKELADVIMTDDGVLYALDKSNDLYVSKDLGQVWHFQPLPARQYDTPAPLFKSMATFANRIYLLDPARNQIWRHPASDLGDAYLPGILPWRLHPDDVDVSDGVDLTVDGTIFVLNRDGSIFRLNPAVMETFDIHGGDEMCNAPGWETLPVRPVDIWAQVDDGPLYVADTGKRRIMLLDRDSGGVLMQITAPDDLNFSSLRGVTAYGDQIAVMAGSYLYLIPMPTSPSWKGALPETRFWTDDDLAGLSAAILPPQDPRIPYILRHAYHFIMPIDGAKLPDRDAIYPGARRAYRYGVHQGMDLFASDVDADIKVGMPVRVVASGRVIRADLDYQEMTYDQVMALLDDANARRITPPDTLDRLGGRQIWVDHGGGVITKYLHLSAIEPVIKVGKQLNQGDVIGEVGLSGTPDGIMGRTQYAHLHFEIRLGPEHQYYFGQWLTTEQTRHAFRDLFPDVAVHPAFTP